MDTMPVSIDLYFLTSWSFGPKLRFLVSKAQFWFFIYLFFLKYHQFWFLYSQDFLPEVSFFFYSLPDGNVIMK